MDKIYAIVPRDKLLHFSLMALLAVAALHIALGLSEWLTLHPVFAYLVLLGAIVGAVKEACDWMDNQTCETEGRPPMHSVEFMDWLATTLGALFIASGLLYMGVV